MGTSEQFTRPARHAALLSFSGLGGGRRREAAPPRPKLVYGSLDPQSSVDGVLGAGPALPGSLQCNIDIYPKGHRVVIFRAQASRSPDTCARIVAALRRGTSGESSEASSLRSKRGLRRSRTTVQKKVRCLSIHSLWTFGKRGKFATLDELWAAWRSFAQIMKRRYRNGFAYVAVPELHADGETWHLHCVFDRFYMVEQLRLYWYRALGGHGAEVGSESPGSVNVKSLRSQGGNVLAVARYISKYVSKGFERGRANRRVFATSVGLNPRKVMQWHSPDGASMVEFADVVRRRLYNNLQTSGFFPRYVGGEGYGCVLVDVQI